MTTVSSVLIRGPFQEDYQIAWEAMQRFTNLRDDNTVDEIWFVEHPPVFTQGQNGQAEHVLDAGTTPVIRTDRGGQVTYHGPGQLMVYTLIDLKRKALSIRALVCALEQAVIDLLASYQVQAFAKRDAPGVYVKDALDQDRKLCSIGLRVRRGAAYHGIALNVNMDLAPFLRINPCGFRGLKMTQLSELTPLHQLQETTQHLIKYLMKNLGYTSANYAK